METFHRLVGVQDASDSSAIPPAQVVSNIDLYGRAPSASHEQDTEAGASVISNRASRASLPLNRQASRKSLREGRSGIPADAPPTPRLTKFTSNSGFQPPGPGSANATSAVGAEQHNGDNNNNIIGGEEDEEDDDDFVWGPEHPCFPHPNVHTAPGSAEFARTRVIRVRRDWLAAGDLYPQYANLYPEILDPLVSDSDFRFLVSNVNAMLQRAFSPFTARAWADGVLGLATGYLWEDLGLTGAKLGARQLARFIDRWNGARRDEGKDVRVVQLQTTGFMSLDFVIPDPGIDAVRDGQDDVVTGIGPAE